MATPLPDRWDWWCDPIAPAFLSHYEEGQAACRLANGEPGEDGGNPHPPHTHEGRAWSLGWNQFYDPAWDLEEVCS